MKQHRGRALVLFTSILATVAIGACHDESATGPQVTGAQFAKPGSTDPDVTGTDPPAAPQDTTLDVTVSGSGFDNGSTVELTLGGVPTEKVRTNSVRYRNSRTLIANITIASDAEVDFYDVEVTTSSRKKGIGTEMFEVIHKAPGNSGEPTDTLTFVFRDLQGSDSVVGDKRFLDATGRTTYTHGECGVGAAFFGEGAKLITSDDPIKQSEITDCDPSGQYGTEGRIFEVHFPQSFGGDGPLEWDGQTAIAQWMEVRLKEGLSLKELPIGQTFDRPLWITFVDKKARSGGIGWGDACPGQLRFDSELQSSTGESATDVQLTRVAADEWKIEAGSDAVAACRGSVRRNEMPVLALYRLPFQVNVVCRGEC